MGSDFGFPIISPPLFGMIVEGNVGIGSPNPTHPLHMGSGAHVTVGGVWTNASSRALKTRIEELREPEALNVLRALNPVTFAYTGMSRRMLNLG